MVCFNLLILWVLCWVYSEKSRRCAEGVPKMWLESASKFVEGVTYHGQAYHEGEQFGYGHAEPDTYVADDWDENEKWR